MSGSSTQNASGVYGTQGTAAANNVPGGRFGAASWTDSSGNFWLFGGNTFNDLWEFNPTDSEWTWVSGSSDTVAAGIYGTPGVASTSNIPGGRSGSVSWIDASGNLWLFGGSGFGSTLTVEGSINDLWEFIPTAKTWTWVSGSSADCVQGVYGAQGIAAASNVPGARNRSVSWKDTSGNFWLFGGETLTGGSNCGGGYETFFNDLWEFDPKSMEWTWMGGSSTVNAVGVYGTQNAVSASNIPGARSNSVSWVDSSGNFWLFGGDSNSAIYNDLWEFNSTSKEWTWVSGSDTAGAKGMYGTQGTAAANNVPGARVGAVSWIDGSGNLWLFGGSGYDSTGAEGGLNDLWEFNSTSKTWTWVSGSSTANAVGVYGTQDTAAANNVPGGRFGAASWTDSSGNLWVFGGQASTGAEGWLNDLWRFQP
jgi:hypothetical protein